MVEQLITFKTAKLAKEKGFDLEFCNVGWHGDFGDLVGDSYPFLGTYSFYKSLYCNNKDEHQIQRPTQSLLQRWLREVHKIDVFCDCIGSGKYYSVIYDNSIKEGNDKVFEQEKETSYEEALEVGLQEGLKLIKDKLD